MRLRKYNQWKINKTVLDSEFQVVDSGNQVLDSWFFVSGTWIPDSNRQWDPNSLSCIPDVDTWMKWITSVQEIFLLMYRPIEILVTRPLGHARDLTTTTWPRGGCGMCLFFPGPWSGVCHQTEKRRKTEAKAYVRGEPRATQEKQFQGKTRTCECWPLTKCYRAIFKSSSFSSNSSPHAWLLSLIYEFIGVTQRWIL